MNNHSDKKKPSVKAHPKLRSILLANPTQESLSTIMKFRLFDQPAPALSEDILCFLPYWEQQACDGNVVIAPLIKYITQSSPRFIKHEKMIHANLLRIQILASTHGIFSFPAIEIQERLEEFLQTSDLLADLPELDIVSFSVDEVAPLASDLTRFRLSPHSRRYIQNLFHAQRREAMLSVLAHMAKNYPLLSTCQKAYALMLSLDNPDLWGRHPFCLRLVANRFWDYQLTKNIEA